MNYEIPQSDGRYCVVGYPCVGQTSGGKSSNLGLQQRMKLSLWSPTGYPFGQFVYAPSIQSDAILFSLL